MTKNYYVHKTKILTCLFKTVVFTYMSPYFPPLF